MEFLILIGQSPYLRTLIRVTVTETAHFPVIQERKWRHLVYTLSLVAKRHNSGKYNFNISLFKVRVFVFLGKRKNYLANGTNSSPIEK